MWVGIFFFFKALCSCDSTRYILQVILTVTPAHVQVLRESALIVMVDRAASTSHVRVWPAETQGGERVGGRETVTTRFLEIVF